MPADKPIYIMPENVSRVLGRDAQRNNILASRIVAETIKSTLGPKGMDKMLVDAIGDITVTNDGVTILEEMQIEHPAAKMIVEIAKTQEEEVGDGTTTAVILAGKLLENAESLLDQKVHPTIITKGYKLAEEKAQELLQDISIKISPENEELLRNIVITAMTGKSVETEKDYLAELIVNAVKQVSVNGRIDKDNIKLVKKRGGGISQTQLIQGIVIDKERISEEMPERIEGAKIALIDSSIEVKSPETDTKISVSTPEQLHAFLDNEEKVLGDMVEKLKENKVNVVICQKGVDDVAQYYMAKEGIFALRRVSKEDMEKIAKATQGKVINSIKDLNSSVLGNASLVEERKDSSGESLTFITGCENPKALTILIRGGTEHVISELERAIKDGIGDIIASLNDGKIVAGGGAIEMELSKMLKSYSQSLSGREQLAVEKFAEAFESIPKILAENAGLDPIDILTELRSKHDDNEVYAGLNLFTEKIENTFENGIIEPLKIKTQAIKSATEVTIMILRIDDIILAGPESGSEKSKLPGMGEY